MYRIIGRLAPLDRALLLLYLDDHDHRGIADVLGISETNVATKLTRLRRRIREDMT
jgi:RNA polymerase sigma-70 factor (ECF subfamily)